MVNCRQHILELKAQYPRATPRIIQVRHNSTFQAWFAQQIREDPMNEDWKVVIKTTPRNLCNMTEEEQVAEADDYLQSQTVRVPLSEDLSHEDNIHWTRTEINGDLVDAPIGFSTLEPSSVLETEEGNEDEEDELEEYAY
ncbi:hypothetical protein LINPERHAP1_LOCUS11398 [Linum perenne]